jgi:predicted phosphate transport protein (TIGR00153 family)
MAFRLPLYGLLAESSPMGMLMEHDELVHKAMPRAHQAVACYAAKGLCAEFQDLVTEVEHLERQADKMKSKIRNHLPRSLFMAVETPLFLTYLVRQDDILNHVQEALHWLGIHPVDIPEGIGHSLTAMSKDAAETVALLRPALDATISLVTGKATNLEAVKEKYQDIREPYRRVRTMKLEIIAALFNTDMDFKAVYQLTHAVECLHVLSHDTIAASNDLRAMIIR